MGIWHIKINIPHLKTSKYRQRGVHGTTRVVYSLLKEVYGSSEWGKWHIRSNIHLIERGLSIVREEYMVHQERYIAN